MIPIPAKDIALRLSVTPETVRRWIREGRLPATKRGRVHYIDSIDAQLFISSYEKVYGENLCTRVKMRNGAYRVRRKPDAPLPQGRTSLYVTLPTPILYRVDEQRRREEEKVSRSEFCEAAISYYVNYLNVQRYNERRKKTT